MIFILVIASWLPAHSLQGLNFIILFATVIHYGQFPESIMFQQPRLKGGIIFAAILSTPATS
jgi:hypothetical protein